MNGNRALSAAQFAARYGIGLRKTLAMIAIGELDALNMATDPRARPQWRITPEAIERFERRRAAQPKEQHPQRRKARAKADDVIEFF